MMSRCMEMALIENTHREDLNAIEVAINYKRSD
jgi:ParB-like chromosome segregation protein Spo0J